MVSGRLQMAVNSCYSSNWETASIFLPLNSSPWISLLSGFSQESAVEGWDITFTAGPSSEASSLAPLETLSWDPAVLSRGPSWVSGNRKRFLPSSLPSKVTRGSEATWLQFCNPGQCLMEQKKCQAEPCLNTWCTESWTDEMVVILSHKVLRVVCYSAANKSNSHWEETVSSGFVHAFVAALSQW